MKKLFIFIFLFLFPTSVSAMMQGPLVTFRFDDRGVQTWKYAVPILAEYGYTGTYFQPVYKINTEGAIRWWQLKTMQNEGWEIGAHGYDLHVDYRYLPLTEVDRQMRLAKQAYRQHGFNVKTYASPLGYYNQNILNIVAQYFRIHAGTRPYGLNSYPWSRWRSVCGGQKVIIDPFATEEAQIQPTIIHGNTPLSVVLDWVDQAKRENKWVILHIHGLVEWEPTRLSQVNIDFFRAVVEYVYNSNIPVVTYYQALGE